MGVEVGRIMNKYSPLKEYLTKRSPEGDHISISFNEVEIIIGETLPKTAYIDRPWWANTQRSNHAKAWLSAGWEVDKVNLKDGVVFFIRQKDPRLYLRPKGSLKGNYRRLQSFLESVPNDQEQLALSFDELEDVIQQKLPRTASFDRPWWANTKASPQGKSWTTAGWNVENIYLKSRTVVFRRKGKDHLWSIQHFVKSLMDKNTVVNKPDNNTLLKWIGLCRRIGWFFEATALYEHGGLSLNTLGEMHSAEVEEHYAICKRELKRYHR